MHSQTAAAAWPAYCRPAGGVRIVDATLIAAPSSTKNADHARAPEVIPPLLAVARSGAKRPSPVSSLA
ncbi:hypothetical protein XANMN_22460 (plasmid) [Xanthomonas phaseoli pv. manihotis str. CIO151]|nr:hypothetical protein XANMN_22460 [Xanthomonas phaseoli pv. manihotis str. CIO151]